MRPRVRRRLLLFLVPATVLVAVAFAVWLSASGGGVPELVVVDERARVLRGVRFGDTAAEIRARLGDEADDEDGFFPAGSDFTGPPAIPSPRSDRGSRIPPEELHYEHTAYLVSRVFFGEDPIESITLTSYASGG